MFRDIDFISPRRIQFTKRLWADNEMGIADCLLLERDPETGNYQADLEITSQRAVLEFANIAFRSLMQNPGNQVYRDRFLTDLDTAYTQMHQEFYDNVLPKAGYHEKFFEHQKWSLAVSAYKKFNMLAFEMGLGKTITSATISKINNIPRTIIICPSLVKWNWFRDLIDPKWGYNELYFTILDATKTKGIRAFQERFVIANYEILENYMDYFAKSPVGHIIIDECHKIKNANTQRYKSIAKLRKIHPDARVTFLSGTPVKNRVNDVFAYHKLIDHPLGRVYTDFVKEYTKSSNGRGGKLKITGAKNLDDLFIRMSNFMIRKTKAECLDLPPKTYMKFRFELDDYKEEYDNVIREIAKQKDISNLNSCIHSLNIVMAKAKINGIIEIAEDILEQDRKVIIFSGYKEPLKMLEKHFHGRCVRIDGSVPSQTRDVLIQKFINDPECTVFLANMEAGGVGINLVNCSDTIFVNFPLTPAELAQAEDRTHRIGQVNNVNIYYTICEQSIDEYLYELITDKADDINALIDRDGKSNMEYRSVPEMLFKRIKEQMKDIIINEIEPTETTPL